MLIFYYRIIGKSANKKDPNAVETTKTHRPELRLHVGSVQKELNNRLLMRIHHMRTHRILHRNGHLPRLPRHHESQPAQPHSLPVKGHEHFEKDTQNINKEVLQPDEQFPTCKLHQRLGGKLLS